MGCRVRSPPPQPGRRQQRRRAGMDRERRAPGSDRTVPRALSSSASLLRGVPRRPSRFAAQPVGRRIAVHDGLVTAIRCLPACAIVIAAPRRVRGDRRQSRGIPVLPASGTAPVAARLERALGQRCGRVTHRTCRRSRDVLAIVEQHCCRMRW